MNYCHFCRHCMGYCEMQPSKFTTTGYNYEYPDHTCKNFRPDFERSDSNSKDDFDGACATCRFYTATCNIYEKVCYNSTRICQNYEIYRDTDW